MNVPPYATSQSITKVFSDSCGPVHSVTFTNNHDNENMGFKNAYLVFKREAGLNKALLLRPEHTFTLSNEDFPVLTGMESKFSTK